MSPFQLVNLTQPMRWVLLLLLLLIAAHSFSQVHASIHAFHEHSEVCDLLDKLGNPTNLTPSFIINLFVGDWQITSLPDYFVVVIHPFLYFYSRAPPTA